MVDFGDPVVVDNGDGVWGFNGITVASGVEAERPPPTFGCAVFGIALVVSVEMGHSPPSMRFVYRW